MTGPGRTARYPGGPSAPPAPGIPDRQSPFQRLPLWMIDAYGLQVGDLPSKLLFPNIQPVTETYRPTVRHLPGAAAPVAGTAVWNPVWQCPPQTMWEILVATFRFDTDANVANRVMHFQVNVPQVGVIHETISNFNQPASIVGKYVYSPSGILGTTSPAGYTTPAVIHLPAPPRIFMLPGDTVQIVVEAGIQAGDVFSFPLLTVKAYTGPATIS